jgi:hypothetical protein
MPQTTFDRGFDEVRCEERERDGHIDLTHAAFLARGDCSMLAAEPERKSGLEVARDRAGCEELAKQRR